MPDIVTGKTFVDGEKGITATKMNQIISQAVIQPSFVTSKPSSSTLDPTDQLLEVKGAGTYATITGSQLISSVSAQVDATPQIYSVRLRSFNAVQNSTFEVDSRNAGNVGGNPANGAWLQDRWSLGKSGTMTANPGQSNPASPVVIPGTNFCITSKIFSVNLTGQQASLGASDNYTFFQFVEGSMFRELSRDVHSISLLVNTTVAGGLKFSVGLRDAGNAYSLIKLCTIPANAWTLVTLPNLPIWTASGTFSSLPGNLGYQLLVCLAAGSSQTTSANDVWVNSAVSGAIGMDNFFSKSVGSLFQMAFVQHEPGAVCTTPMDCPFTRNYDECLRYYSKSYDYGTKAGTITNLGRIGFITPSGWSDIWGRVKFPKPMAKIPALTIYDPNNGAANSIYDGAVHHTVTATPDVNTDGFSDVTFTTGLTGMLAPTYHYIADTGW